MQRSVLVALCLTVGCGGEEPQAPSTGPAFQPPICDDPHELCLPEPTQGFQIQTEGAVIAPGEDVEYCEVVALPGTADDVYYVTAFESQMTQGSHHLIVAAIEPGTQTDENAEVGARIPCSGVDGFGGEVVPVTGGQKPYQVDAFPTGVGRIYHGGQKVVFDYHYFNTSTEPLRARAAVNFHLTGPEGVQKIAQAFGFYNLAIEIPPDSERSFTAECLFGQDLIVHKLTRHTHRWGTDFSVELAGGPNDGEHVFTSPDYESVDYPFAEPLLMRAGEGFRFTCSYRNTESYTLKFGLEATDEMCILFGSWYVVDPGDAVADQSCFLF